jgi:hypothetical protein
VVSRARTRDADRVHPLLQKIEAQVEPGCYTLTFTLPAGEEQAVILRMRDGAPVLPSVNIFAGWSQDSAAAAAAVVQALHQARELAGSGRPTLADVDGGWDVGIGNVVLSEDGRPSCVAHGELDEKEASVYRCDTCGAAARFSN